MRSPKAKRSHSLAEFDMVRTRATILAENHLFPSGSLGAIVLVHRDGRAFEVEFTAPLPTVMTLEASELEAA